MARTKEYNAYLLSPEWQGKRKAALQRAGNRCQVCNSPSRLDAHHRTYERFGEELAGDITVLCRPCHELFHGSGGKTERTVAVTDDLTNAIRKRIAQMPRGQQFSSGQMRNWMERAHGASRAMVVAVFATLVTEGQIEQMSRRRWRKPQ